MSISRLTVVLSALALALLMNSGVHAQHASVGMDASAVVHDELTSAFLATLPDNAAGVVLTYEISDQPSDIEAQFRDALQAKLDELGVKVSTAPSSNYLLWPMMVDGSDIVSLLRFAKDPILSLEDITFTTEPYVPLPGSVIYLRVNPLDANKSFPSADDYVQMLMGDEPWPEGNAVMVNSGLTSFQVFKEYQASYGYGATSVYEAAYYAVRAGEDGADGIPAGVKPGWDGALPASDAADWFDSFLPYLERNEVWQPVEPLGSFQMIIESAGVGVRWPADKKPKPVRPGKMDN